MFVPGAAEKVGVEEELAFEQVDLAGLLDVDEDGEIPMVHSGFHGVSSSGDGEGVFSSSATEVDECFEEWLTADVAERLMEFLKRELPSE